MSTTETETRTDREKVAAAFKVLRAGGITALMNYQCCSSCALAALSDRGLGDDSDYVFYHRQCSEAFAGSGDLIETLYVYHGGKLAGYAAVGALRAQGLDASWDGNEHAAIEVAVATEEA